MPIRLLVILRFLGTLSGYGFITILLPSVALGEKMRGRRFPARILCYFTVGNFYVINLVFLFQFLHISNFFTLWTGILVPVAAFAVKTRHIDVKAIAGNAWHSFQMLLSGRLGLKTAVLRLFHPLARLVSGKAAAVGRNFRHCFLDWVFTSAIVLALLWLYGPTIWDHYGFLASDMVVHLSWINAMDSHDIFTAGIYPFGLHCMVYFLHTVFRTDAYVILKAFGFVQCLCLQLAPLLVLKLCCKNRFVPYLGVGIYLIGNFFGDLTYRRFANALPQEFGVVFIFPVVYYGYRYFKLKNRELSGTVDHTRVKYALIGLAMNFSLTLSAHFYSAAVAGVFIAGMAVGYAFLFFRRKVFWEMVRAMLISAVIGLLPLGIGLLTGVGLQGSMYWGMNIINPEGPQQTVTEAGVYVGVQDQEEESAPPEESEAESRTQVGTVLLNGVEKVWKAFQDRVNIFVLRVSTPVYTRMIALWGLVLLLVGGILLFSKKGREYGGMLVSAVAGMAFLTLLLIGPMLGLKRLIGEDRLAIYFAYMLQMIFCFVVDVLFCAVTWLAFRKQWISDGLMVGVLAAALVVLWQNDLIKKPPGWTDAESNEAITCVSSIISREKDDTWTILSANDERLMISGHGFHYEMIDFLVENMHPNSSFLTIPTETVYFFVEKIPVDFYVHYSDSGQAVSLEGASRPLPANKGITMYQGEKRWVVMSHMYEWAKAFQHLYPNEMKVYMETDSFVCYRLEQNPFRLYDLSIEYGYNNTGMEKIEE